METLAGSGCISQQCGTDHDVVANMTSWSLPSSILLANILQYMQWKDVIIVFDDEYDQRRPVSLSTSVRMEESSKYLKQEQLLPDLTQQLSNKGITFMLFSYTIMTPEKILNQLLLTGSESWRHHLHFLLLCLPLHVACILDYASDFEAKHRMRSALSMTSEWFILQDPDAADVALHQMTMTNVAALNCHIGKSCCAYPTPTSASSCGLIMTMAWPGNHSWKTCLGTVDDVISGGMEVFPGKTWGFNQRVLRVSTLPWAGYVETREESDGSIHYFGFCIDLLQELVTQLNFTYQLTQPPEKLWGMEQDNGSWDGLIGQLVRSEVDLVVAPITMTQQREHVMDFSYPYFVDVDTIIYKRPDPKEDKWKTYLRPFSWQVLVLIAVSVVIASITLGFVESSTPFYPSNRLRGFRDHPSCYLQAIQLVFGALIAQAGVELPKAQSGRLLLSLWWMFSLVMGAIYSGNLVAFLTVDKTSPLFSTLHHLMHQNTYKWGFMGSSAIHQTVEASNSSLYAEMNAKVQKWMTEDPEYLTEDVDLRKARLLQGQYAFVSDRATLEHWKAVRCDLELTKETFLPIEYAVGLPNDSAYVRVFSEKILLMHENGLLTRMREKWWPYDNATCDPSTTTRVTAVTVVDMQSGFYLLLLGAALGTLTLCLEYFLTLIVFDGLKKHFMPQKAA